MDETNEKWLTPNKVIVLGLVPFGYGALIDRLKSREIKSVLTRGHFYTKEEWIEDYLENNKKGKKNGRNKKINDRERAS